MPRPIAIWCCNAGNIVTTPPILPLCVKDIQQCGTVVLLAMVFVIVPTIIAVAGVVPSIVMAVVGTVETVVNATTFDVTGVQH